MTNRKHIGLHPAVSRNAQKDTAARPIAKAAVSDTIVCLQRLYSAVFLRESYVLIALFRKSLYFPTFSSKA